MGIKGANKLIDQYAKKSLSEQKIEEFKGSKIAIDSEILIYKFRANGDSKNSHLLGFMNNIFWFLKNGVLPVYIFDGKPVCAKQQNALSKRTINKERLYKHAEDLENKCVEQFGNLDTAEDMIHVLDDTAIEDFNNLIKLKKRISGLHITKDHKRECKYLLKVMGIPYITANDDAEALCVTLQHHKLVNYVYTEDTDALTYAAALNDTAIILKKGDVNNNTVKVVNLSILLKELGLSRESFLDMCILCGCDFSSGIPRIGPAKSYNYMKEHASIETFLEKTGIVPPSDFQYDEARKIFRRNHMEGLQIGEITLSPIMTEDFKRYLREERNMDPMPFLTEYNKCHKIFKEKRHVQPTIESFFSRSSAAAASSSSIERDSNVAAD